MDQGISNSNTPAELIVYYKLEVASVTFSYCGGSVVAYAATVHSGSWYCRSDYGFHVSLLTRPMYVCTNTHTRHNLKIVMRSSFREHPHLGCIAPVYCEQSIQGVLFNLWWEESVCSLRLPLTFPILVCSLNRFLLPSLNV